MLPQSSRSDGNTQRGDECIVIALREAPAVAVRGGVQCGLVGGVDRRAGVGGVVHAGPSELLQHHLDQRTALGSDRAVELGHQIVVLGTDVEASGPGRHIGLGLGTVGIDEVDRAAADRGDLLGCHVFRCGDEDVLEDLGVVAVERLAASGEHPLDREGMPLGDLSGPLCGGGQGVPRFRRQGTIVLRHTGACAMDPVAGLRARQTELVDEQLLHTRVAEPAGQALLDADLRQEVLRVRDSACSDFQAAERTQEFLRVEHHGIQLRQALGRAFERGECIQIVR